MQIHFKVKGKLNPKQSARFFVGDNGKIRSYQNEKVQETKSLIQYSFLKKYTGYDINNFKDEALSVEIIIFIEPPKSWSKKRKEQAYNDEIMPTVKPDVDNYAKAILDAMNGVVYPDDRQIVALKVTKFYSEESFTHITVSKF